MTAFIIVGYRPRHTSMLQQMKTCLSDYFEHIFKTWRFTENDSLLKITLVFWTFSSWDVFFNLCMENCGCSISSTNYFPLGIHLSFTFWFPKLRKRKKQITKYLKICLLLVTIVPIRMHILSIHTSKEKLNLLYTLAKRSEMYFVFHVMGKKNNCGF